MSDVSINLDDLLAFLVAALLGGALLLAFVLRLLYRRFGPRRQKEGVTSRRNFAPVSGMLVSAAGFAAIALIIFMRDGPAYSHALERWLDRWVVFWTAAILLLWPVSGYVMRRAAPAPR